MKFINKIAICSAFSFLTICNFSQSSVASSYSDPVESSIVQESHEKNNTFYDIMKMMESFDRSFNSSQNTTKGTHLFFDTWSPSVDINEQNDAFFIIVELAGVNKEDVSVSIEKNVVTIKGEKKYTFAENDSKPHRTENSYGSFVRSFSLPNEIIKEKAEAKFENGILKLILPKLSQEDRKKKVYNLEIK